MGEEKLGPLQGGEEFLTGVFPFGKEIAARGVQALVDRSGGFEIHLIQGGKKTVIIRPGHGADAGGRCDHLPGGGADTATAHLLGIRGDEGSKVPNAGGIVEREPRHFATGRLLRAREDVRQGIRHPAAVWIKHGGEVNRGRVAGVTLEFAGNGLGQGQPLVFLGSGAGGVPRGGNGSCIDIHFAGFVIGPPSEAAHDGIFPGNFPTPGPIEGLEGFALIQVAQGAVLQHVNPTYWHGQLLLGRVDPEDDLAAGFVAVFESFGVLEQILGAGSAVVSPGVDNGVGKSLEVQSALGGAGTVGTGCGIDRPVHVGEFIRAFGPVRHIVLVDIAKQFSGLVGPDVANLGNVGGVEFIKPVPGDIRAAESADGAGLGNPSDNVPGAAGIGGRQIGSFAELGNDQINDRILQGGDPLDFHRSLGGHFGRGGHIKEGDHQDGHQRDDGQHCQNGDTLLFLVPRNGQAGLETLDNTWFHNFGRLGGRRMDSGNRRFKEIGLPFPVLILDLHCPYKNFQISLQKFLPIRHQVDLRGRKIRKVFS